jgi:hypothetical protein
LAQIMTSFWFRKFASVIAAATLCAAAVGYVGGLQSGSLKKSFSQMRYHGGPKSPMWRG